MTSSLDDAIQSRFEVDVDFRPDSVRNLDEVTTLLSRARTEAEALSRSSGNVVEHLREAAATEPIHLTDQDQGGLTFGGGSSSMSPAQSVGDRIAPIAGPGQDNNGGPSTGSPANSGSGGGSDENPFPKTREQEVTEKLQEVNDRDPERMENIRASRRKSNSDDNDNSGPEGIAQSVEGFSNLAQSILSETSPGRSMSQTAASLAGGLGQGGGMAGMLGSRGLGAVGLAGGVLTAGVAANAAVQAGGQQLQGYTNMGSIRGEGAVAGASHEMGIRAMALNPMLTNDQSRQIIMSALNDGYSGDQFESVTDFLSKNLTDMNLDVGQSTQLLRKNVEEGGQSIQQLSADLAILKSSVGGGVMSLEERTQRYQNTSGELIDYGISGQAASNIASSSLQLFDDDRHLSGLMADIVANPSDQLTMQAGWQRDVQGGTPFQMRMLLGESEQLGSGIWDVIYERATAINSASGNTKPEKQENFYRFLHDMGINVDENQSNKLFEQAISDGGADLYTNAEEDQYEDSYGTDESKNGPVASRFKEVGGFFGVGMQAIGDTLGMINMGAFVEDETFVSNFTEAYSSTGEKFQKSLNNQVARASDGQIEALTAYNDHFGANNIMIVDAEGKERSQLGGLSREQLESIESGESKVKIRGRDPVRLDEVRALMDENHFEDDVEETSSTVKVEVSSTPELERLLKFNTRTKNQKQSDSGFGNSTHNNPPPGDD